MRTFLAAVVLFLVSLNAASARPDAAPLPYYADAAFTPLWNGPPVHNVGAFTLTAHTGATVTERDLAGRVHIANFMFTRCGNICPAVMSQLKKVQAALEGTTARIVSYSVTPEIDPPDLLAAFAATRGVDDSRWWLMTGDREVIYRLARESYFAGDSRVSSTDGILHSEKILLVDTTGRLRGVYNGTQPRDIERLIEDAREIMR
jgi:protein SCO1/2